VDKLRTAVGEVVADCAQTPQIINVFLIGLGLWNNLLQYSEFEAHSKVFIVQDLVVELG